MLRPGGWRRGPGLTIDQKEVAGRWRGFVLRDNQWNERSAKLVGIGLDPTPAAEIEGQTFHPAPPLRSFEAAFVSMPMALGLFAGWTAFLLTDFNDGFHFYFFDLVSDDRVDGVYRFQMPPVLSTKETARPNWSNRSAARGAWTERLRRRPPEWGTVCRSSWLDLGSGLALEPSHHDVLTLACDTPARPPHPRDIPTPRAFANQSVAVDDRPGTPVSGA